MIHEVFALKTFSRGSPEVLEVDYPEQHSVLNFWSWLFSLDEKCRFSWLVPFLETSNTEVDDT
jgi:hypothetical protein